MTCTSDLLQRNHAAIFFGFQYVFGIGFLRKNLSSPHSLSGDMTGRLSRKHDSLVYLSHETDGRAFLTKFIANITVSVCARQSWNL